MNWKLSEKRYDYLSGGFGTMLFVWEAAKYAFDIKDVFSIESKWITLILAGVVMVSVFLLIRSNNKKLNDYKRESDEKLDAYRRETEVAVSRQLAAEQKQLAVEQKLNDKQVTERSIILSRSPKGHKESVEIRYDGHDGIEPIRDIEITLNYIGRDKTTKREVVDIFFKSDDLALANPIQKVSTLSQKDAYRFGLVGESDTLDCKVTVNVEATGLSSSKKVSTSKEFEVKEWVW
jgi:hypothetical protein